TVPSGRARVRGSRRRPRLVSVRDLPAGQEAPRRRRSPADGRGPRRRLGRRPSCAASAPTRGKNSVGGVSNQVRGVRSRGEGRPEAAAGRGGMMTQYLISFDDGAMTFPEEDLPDVAKAAHEVVQEAKAAGVCRCAQEVRELLPDPEV